MVPKAHGGRWRAMTVVEHARANRIYAGAVLIPLTLPDVLFVGSVSVCPSSK